MPQTQIVNIQIKLKYMGCIFKAAHIKNSILSHLACTKFYILEMY